MHANDTLYKDFYVALKHSTYSMLVAFVQNKERNRKLGKHKARRRRRRKEKMVTEIQLQSIIGYSFLESRHLSLKLLLIFRQGKPFHFVGSVCIKTAQTIVNLNKSMDFVNGSVFCLVVGIYACVAFRALTPLFFHRCSFYQKQKFLLEHFSFSFLSLVCRHCVCVCVYYVNDRLHFMI